MKYFVIATTISEALNWATANGILQDQVVFVTTASQVRGYGPNDGAVIVLNPDALDSNTIRGLFASLAVGLLRNHHALFSKVAKTM